MIGPVFVDTNVFVYLHDDSEPEKKLRADDWIAFLVGHRSGRLSFQVLQEFYTILTRKLKLGFEEGEPQKIVRELASWQPVPIDFAVLEHAWLLEERYFLSWWGRPHRRGCTDLRVRGFADRGFATRPDVQCGPGGRSLQVAGPDACRGSGSVGKMNWSGEQDRRLIEDPLPLDVLNAISAKEKLHLRY